MPTYIFIIGLVIILWPLIGGLIGTIFTLTVMAVSLPLYWLMRIVKHPKSSAEDRKLTQISSGISMVITVIALLALLIYSLI